MMSDWATGWWWGFGCGMILMLFLAGIASGFYWTGWDHALKHGVKSDGEAG